MMKWHKHNFHFAEIPINLIARDPEQPRRDFGTEGDKNRILLSIQQYGIETPIAVTEYEPGRYKIIDGHRRYICAQRLGFERVPCRVYPSLSDKELETRRYEIQNNRRPWQPLERSEALERIKNTHNFISNRQLAEHLGITEAVVANSLQLRKQKFDHVDLMKEYGLSESYMNEFVRLKPKLRKVHSREVDEIIEIIFQRIRDNVITSSKELRKLGRVFRRATANEEWLSRYLSDPDMTIGELEKQTLQSGFSLHVEEVIKYINDKNRDNERFDAQERAFLNQLKNLLQLTLD